MSLSERLQTLEPRERRLLLILGGVFVVLIVVALPIGTAALLGSKQSENDEVRSVIEEIQQGREVLRKRAVERERVTARYANPAPALGGMLETLAKESGIEIPESQDRAVIPHGKRYEEKSTKIVLRRVGMLNLVKFMERIEQSGHPVSLSSLNIRKRGAEVDSYDVELAVSAFERKAEAAGGKKAQGAAKDESENAPSEEP